MRNADSPPGSASVVIMEDAVKRFVWPALKTFLAVVVAVALVKIAFFPSQNEGATADISPGYAADVKTATVTTGSISNTVEVKGRIVQDAAVDVQADLAGVVDSVAVEKDTQVNAGDLRRMRFPSLEQLRLLGTASLDPDDAVERIMGALRAAAA